MSDVWAVLAVKNEADIITGTLEHLDSEQVDGIVVCDNDSSDDTRDLIAGFARTASCRVVVLDDHEIGYWQSQRMTRLAQVAADHDADWIVPVDADECWYAPEPLGPWLSGQDPRIRVIGAELWNHWATAVDPDEPNPYLRMSWRAAEPGALPKVCARWRPGMVIDQGNHSVSFEGSRLEASGAQVHIRHFPYRSADQFVAKARTGAEAYAATDLPADVGAHWRQYGQLLDLHGEEALRDVFRTHFWHLSPIDAGMALDPAPWCRW